jgi:hypothetical protein
MFNSIGACFCKVETSQLCARIQSYEIVPTFPLTTPLSTGSHHSGTELHLAS